MKLKLHTELDKLKSFLELCQLVVVGFSTVTTRISSEGDWKLEKSVATHLPLSAIPEERAELKFRITKLLAIVAGIMSPQKVAVEEFEETTLAGEFAKKPRTNNSNEVVQNVPLAS